MPSSDNEMKVSVFNGRASEMRDSPWLAREDFDGLGDITLTIERCFKVENVKFAHGSKDVAYAVAFANAKRRLVLNATNRLALKCALGNDVRNWPGAKVTLYIDDKVRAPDGTRGGIRIRNVEKQSGDQ